MLGVSADDHQRLRRRLEQGVVDGSLVGERDVGERSRQGEHDVVVGHGKKIPLAGFEPVMGGRGLALRAMPVAAGVVGDLVRAAALAAQHVSAQRRTAALFDGRHHLELTQAQVAALQAGQIDMVLRVDRQALALFAENPAFTAQSVTTGGWVGLAMRADTAPFTDARVRRALRIFADRDAMGKLVFGEGGYTVTCDNPVWSGDQYRADLTCPADIASAKSLLAEAGYPNGIVVKLYVSDIAAGAMQLAEVYQAQAKAAGINVEIVSTPSDGYWNDVWMKEGFVATTWSQRPADQILNEAYRSTAAWNETFWQDAGFDALLDKARQELSLEGRTATYVAAQTQLFDEGGTFIPFHINETRILSSRLSGLPAVEEFTIRYEDIQKAE